MANTTNLNLVKPAGTDHALVAQINSNMDIIDGAIGALPSGKTVQGQINDLDTKAGNMKAKDYGTLADAGTIKATIIGLLGTILSEIGSGNSIFFSAFITGRGCVTGICSLKNSIMQFNISVEKELYYGYYISSNDYFIEGASSKIDTFIKSKTFSVTTDATGCVDINASNLGYLRTKCLILAVVTNIATGDTVYPIIGVYRASTSSWTIKFEQGNSVVASQTFNITVWYVLLE